MSIGLKYLYADVAIPLPLSLWSDLAGILTRNLTNGRVFH